MSYEHQYFDDGTLDDVDDYDDYDDYDGYVYTDMDYASVHTFREILTIDMPLRWRLKVALFRAAFFIRRYCRMARYRLNKWWFFVTTGRD